MMSTIDKLIDNVITAATNLMEAKFFTFQVAQRQRILDDAKNELRAAFKELEELKKGS